MAKSLVNIESDPHAEPDALLARALEEARFWPVLEAAFKRSKREQADFSILIKPDLEVFETPSATATDPKLVEALIDQLHARGFSNVAVADAVGSPDLWLDNRDVAVLADLAGYRYETPGGHAYDVLNLSENLRAECFNPASILRDEPLSDDWVSAGFRILFSKNKTDEAFRYALGLKNLLGVLPSRAKEYHYQHRLNIEAVAADLLQAYPPHFCLIDAVQSNHGYQGIRHHNPLATHTLIAGEQLLLTDWVAALKMNLDPYASPLNAHALRHLGLPKTYDIRGELAPYEGWQNVPMLLSESVRRRNQHPAVHQLANAWLQTVDKEQFPFKKIPDAQINAVLSPVAQHLESHPMAYWGMVGLNYMLAGVQQMMETWQILYDKDRLYRQTTDLGFDPEQFQKADFEAIDDYVLPLAQIAKHTQPDKNGLKWRYIDGSVLFEYTRILPFPYTAFVEKMDIAQAVEFMYDNIGGARQTVQLDQTGAVLYQAERDVYLPQPNWIVLFGGPFIDVCKIEVIRRLRDSQTILWRTVSSLNNSATFDDGLVRFNKHAGGTEVTIVARQKFTLPLFFQVVNMDYFPKMKDTLVSDAYISFFSRTMANLEAVWEGRDPRAGRRWDAAYGETSLAAHPLEAEQLKNLFSVFSGVVERWVKKSPQGEGFMTDEFGYRHSSTAAAEVQSPAEDLLREFWGGLAKAVQNDIQYISSPKQTP